MGGVTANPAAGQTRPRGRASAAVQLGEEPDDDLFRVHAQVAGRFDVIVEAAGGPLQFVGDGVVVIRPPRSHARVSLYRSVAGVRSGGAVRGVLVASFCTVLVGIVASPRLRRAMCPPTQSG